MKLIAAFLLLALAGPTGAAEFIYIRSQGRLTNAALFVAGVAPAMKHPLASEAARAAALMKEAADAGRIDACRLVAEHYRLENKALAVEYYRRAAERGDLESHVALADLLPDDQGRVWLEKAVAKKHAPAKKPLASLYLRFGSAADKRTALQWCEEHEWFSLMALYGSQREQYKWMRVAQMRGYPVNESRLRALRKSAAADLEAGEREASDYVAQRYR